MQEIELLAPAGNVDIGRSAIMSGADAVYIGAPEFGARANAGNSMDEIAGLVNFAHLFDVKVYLTMNTILYDDELDRAYRIASEAEDIGVDALIVQDMAYLKMDLKRIALHASTQTCNFDVDRIKLIEKSGFDRIVLERSLSLDEINRIRKETNIEIETFVHGAMCVGFSGNCYLSQYLCGRSGNRGVCAQSCRSKYNLYDEDGKLLRKSSSLLSVEDIDFSDRICSLIESGVTSFKIEGRLKNESYVVNNVSYYNKLLNKLGVKRTSKGYFETRFNPNVRKSFFRGTNGNMFLIDRRARIGASTKSLGEYIGKVTAIHNKEVTISTNIELHNGDGLSWIRSGSDVQSGAFVNKVTPFKNGVSVLLTAVDNIALGLDVYRNQDSMFSPDGKDVNRQICIDIQLVISRNLFEFQIDDFHYSVKYEYVPSKKDSINTIKSSLSKTGDSVFLVRNIDVKCEVIPFLRISELNKIRRELFDSYSNYIIGMYKPMEHRRKISDDLIFPKELSYKWNVANSLAMNFYKEHGTLVIEEPFEKQTDLKGKNVMTSRHCVRRQEGLCPRNNPSVSVASPLYLENNGKKLKAVFDCSRCLMYIEVV